MTVAELIEELGKLPPDYEVRIDSGGWDSEENTAESVVEVLRRASCASGKCTEPRLTSTGKPSAAKGDSTHYHRQGGYVRIS